MDKEISHPLFSKTSWLLQRLVYPLCRLYYFRFRQFRLIDLSDLNEVEVPLLLAVAPHTKHTDVVVVPASLPSHLLPVRWLADEKLFTNKIKSFWLKLWGAIPVKRNLRGEIQTQDIEVILKFNKKNNCLGIFPECCLVGRYFDELHQDLINSALQIKLPVYPVGLTHIDLSTDKSLSIEQSAYSKVEIGVLLSNPEDLMNRWSNL